MPFYGAGTGINTELHQYAYDYRTRRVLRDESGAGGGRSLISFSGGLSVQEWTVAPAAVQPDPAADILDVLYVRGSDYGGGIGGVLYTLRDVNEDGQLNNAAFNHYNSRGDVVARMDDSGALMYQAAYEAFGRHGDSPGTQEWGGTADRQQANTKDEDPTGLLNEGFRYRCLETGVFITRDPLGFVDGPNLYSYVRQNPWSYYDPEGLFLEKIKEVGEGIRRGREGKVDASDPDSSAFKIGMMIGGAASGAKDGYRAGNEIVANELSFGLTDRVGLTDSQQYTGGAYDFSRGSATLAREVGLTALSGGTATAASSGSRGALAMNRGLQAFGSGRSIMAGSSQISEGDYAGGAVSLTFGVLGARGLNNNIRNTGIVAGRSPGQLGKDGESAISAATGLSKNTKSFVVNNRTRIPDFVSGNDVTTRLPTHLIESKNVQYQSLTRQLRDYADMVRPYGGRVDVALPPTARVSRPLQRAFENPYNPLFRRDLIIP